MGECVRCGAELENGLAHSLGDCFNYQRRLIEGLRQEVVGLDSNQRMFDTKIEALEGLVAEADRHALDAQRYDQATRTSNAQELERVCDLLGEHTKWLNELNSKLTVHMANHPDAPRRPDTRYDAGYDKGFRAGRAAAFREISLYSDERATEVDSNKPDKFGSSGSQRLTEPDQETDYRYPVKPV